VNSSIQYDDESLDGEAQYELLSSAYISEPDPPDSETSTVTDFETVF